MLEKKSDQGRKKEVRNILPRWERKPSISKTQSSTRV